MIASGSTRIPGQLRAAALLALVTLLATPSFLLARQGVERLTMDEAVERAQRESAALRALGHRVEEQRHVARGMRANYLPLLETQVNYQYFQGSDDLPVDLGNGLFVGMTTLSQPLTHAFRIREGHGVARADEAIARAELRRVQNEIALGTMKLYGGLLIAERQREAARAEVAAAEERTVTRRAAASSGSALEVANVEARVRVLEARQRLVEAESQIESHQYDLAELVGLPPGTRIELVQPGPLAGELASLDEYVELALRESPEVLEAQATVRKAEFGVGEARSRYIPEVGLAVTHFYQSSLSFFPKSSFGLGFQLNWDILDFGRRSNVVGERRAQLAQARANLRLVEGRVRGEVEKNYRQLRHAETMVLLAREASALRAEASRLQAGQERAGLVLASDASSADAQALQGVADLVAAELGYRLAVAELLRAAGQLVP